MGHNLLSIGARTSPDELLKGAYAALAEGRLVMAEQLLDQVPGKSPPAALLRAHLESAKGEPEEARRWARTAIHRSRSMAARTAAMRVLKRLSNEAPEDALSARTRTP